MLFSYNSYNEKQYFKHYLYHSFTIHRMVEVEQNLCGPSSPLWLFKQGQLKQVA